MVPGGRTGGFSDTEEKPGSARDARRDLPKRIRIPTGRAVVTKFKTHHRLRVRASSEIRGHAEAFAGRRLTIGDGRSTALNRQSRNGPLNFSSH